MGGYPSHDAPNFLFATAAQHPNNGGTTEICLIPLIRRHFNDTNKKLKDAVAQIYFKGPPNTTATAIAAMHPTTPSNRAPAPPTAKRPAAPLDAAAKPSLRNASNTSSGSIVPPVLPLGGPAVSPDVNEEQKRKAVHAYKSMENLLNEIECSFFATTRGIYESAKFASEKVKIKEAVRAAAEAERQKAKSAAAGGGETPQKPVAPPIPAGEGDEAAANTPTNNSATNVKTADGAAKATAPHASMSAPVLRPVPCAVCIIEPDTSGRKGGGGGSHVGSDVGGVNAAVLNVANVQAGGTEWVTIQGRRLRCIGYLSCFSKSPAATEEAKAASDAGTEAGTGPKSPLSLDGKPSLSVPRISECEPTGLDVYMELLLENESKYMHLLEPVVFLASIMFRSQYLTSSMLQRPVHSTEVENAFYSHLQMLNIHVRLSKDRVHHLKVLQDQLPLMEFVDEMGLNGKHTPSASVGGAAGEGAADGAVVKGEVTTAAMEAHVAGDAQTAAASTTAAAAADGEGEGEKGGEVADKAAAHTTADDSDDGSDDDDDDEDETKSKSAEVAGEGGDVASGANGETKAESGEAAQKDGDNGEDDDDDDDDNKDAATDGEKENRPSNLSTSGTSRRTRRSRRRQRKPKVAQPQDEIYRKTRCHLPTITLYTNSKGEKEGLEAVFDGALLARLMKLIAETAAFETVKNTFIRCDLGPLMKERRHLLQSHREAMQEDGSAERQDERLMGSTQNTEMVRRWISEGLQLEEENRKKEEAAAQEAHAAQLLQAAAAAAAPAQQQAQPPQVLQKPHMLPNGTILPPGAMLPTNPAMAAAAAAAMGQNPAIASMGMLPASQPHAGGPAAPNAAPGAPMMVFVPGMGYMTVPNNSMMLPQAAAAAAQPTAAPSAQPTYIINPATGLPMMIAPPQVPSANASTTATPPQAQIMSFPNMMQLYNSQQQQQQQQQQHQQHAAAQQAAQQQAMMAAAPQYYAQHPSAAPQQQQQQYQYMMGPNGQLLMVPVMSAPTAQPQQQYMMAAAQSAQAGQMQQPVYMNPYMMNMSAQQQQAQQQQQQQQQQAHQQQQAQLQHQMQQMYIHQLQAQQLARQQQGQQQQQLQQYQQLQQAQQAAAAAGHPFTMAALPGMQPGQQHPGVVVGPNAMSMPGHAARTPTGTPPQQGSPAAAGMSNPQLPPHLAANYANMYAMAAAAQQQQQQQQMMMQSQQQQQQQQQHQQQQASSTASSTPVQKAKAAPKIGNAGSAVGSDAHVAGSRASPSAPFNYVTINDDDDDDDDEAVALAAATAAMEAIRGHGGADGDSDDDGEDDDTSQFFSNGQFFFRTQ